MCRICMEAPKFAARPLLHAANPILQLSATARLLIASQAPGNRAHKSGIPFDDASGDRLRDWLGVDRATFYDETRIAIVPMGFCFPGNDAKGGDLPPRPECRKQWHDRLFAHLPQIETILTVGRYAQAYHFARLGRPYDHRALLSQTIKASFADRTNHPPRVFALPHPSWRNSGWLNQNDWFSNEMLPILRMEVAHLLTR